MIKMLLRLTEDMLKSGQNSFDATVNRWNNHD